jgi:hypothetical protein
VSTGHLFIVRVVTTRTLWWAERIAQMGKRMCIKSFGGKPFLKQPIWRLRKIFKLKWILGNHMRMWDDICLLQLFVNHHVRMEVTAYLSMCASAHKNSEVLNVSMVSHWHHHSCSDCGGLLGYATASYELCLKHRWGIIMSDSDVSHYVIIRNLLGSFFITGWESQYWRPHWTLRTFYV